MHKSILCGVFLAVSLQLQTQSPVNPAIAQILQQRLDSCINTFDLPGISATILFPGDRYWNGASGLSDIYTQEPVDTAMVFYQASVTKMFVAAMVLQMAEQGELSLNDSIGHYLPPIQHVNGHIKIRSLMNHRSGIADFLTPQATATWLSQPDSVWDPKTAIETFIGPPLFNEGSGFSYSNTNYVLLGMIIEQVTGNSFAQELHTRFLTPFGLTRTFFRVADSISGPRVKGWTSFSFPGVYDTDAAQILNNSSMSMGFTAGALVSTPADVARFNRLLYTGQIIHDSLLTLMKQCTNVNFGNNCNGYGHGSMRYIFGGKTYFGHAGDISGFTQLSIHQETDSLTLTISINRNNAPRGPIAATLLEAVEQALSLSATENHIPELTAQVFPNPASDILHISLPGYAEQPFIYRLYNTSGATVQSGTGCFPYNADISVLPVGMYYLDIQSAYGHSVQKVIIR